MTLTPDTVLAAIDVANDKLAEVEATLGEERTRLKNTIAKLIAWLRVNQPMTLDDAAAGIVRVRDRRTELKKQFDAEDALLRAEAEQYDAFLLERMGEQDIASAKLESGTAYTQVKTRYNVSDWDSYWGWLLTHKRLDLLEKRPAQSALAKMDEAGEDMPPGLSKYTERTVTVRRA